MSLARTVSKRGFSCSVEEQISEEGCVRNRLLAADNPSGWCSGSARLAVASEIISCLSTLSTTPELSSLLSSLLVDRLDAWGKEPKQEGGLIRALAALAVLVRHIYIHLSFFQ